MTDSPNITPTPAKTQDDLVADPASTMPASRPASPPDPSGNAKSTPEPVASPSDPSDIIAPAPATNAEDTSSPEPTVTSAPNETMVNGTHVFNPADPLGFGRHRRENTSTAQMKTDHPNAKPRKVKKFYTRQNKLIDQFLGADDEERLAIEEDIRMGPRIRFAVNASFLANFCLFVIQTYAAISTGSLALFATAADAFMDLVSSFVMLVTSRMAARPSVYKYPVGRTRIETIGVILFCCLMTTVAIQLIIESGRSLGAGDQGGESLHLIPIIFVSVAIFSKGTLMVYCFFYRKFPSVHVFFIDHRNDIAVNLFGLIMAITGDKFVWYLDPIGAILIALIILFSWCSNAFEQIWLLVGKSAPQPFVSKLVYISMTHDPQITKVDTCRAYHAGQKYYVEIDIVMDEETPLRVSHDVAQSLQRKIEGLADVERAFVHVDYEDDHDIHEEHKPLYDKDEAGQNGWRAKIFGPKKKGETELKKTGTDTDGTKEKSEETDGSKSK
ncbi:related to Metal tolerance protein 7 [Cephalotrichum gorgonifer]|uniref:Related to Metal tolerance protein 7 n=1 Tax=Cephalotrichum gorgonifer TaxID=2041049 RepID=A0AAE8N2K6_9PEZI|nr:related to Metal tolerance protein 7 [Cephalotrichum gorgonifer]